MASEIKVDTIVNAGGDNDTGIDLSTNDQVKVKIAGSTDLTFKANEIENSSGDLTLDVAGDIILDADGADIRLSDGGTQFGKFTRSSGDFKISSSENDKDIIFAGADGGADIEAMRIDMSAGGEILFGTTARPSSSVGGACFEPAGDNRMILNLGCTSTSSRNVAVFRNSNDGVGSINVSGSSTGFNTSSDYRLKENVVTDWDATTRLKQLKPSRFNFKTDKDTTVDGFLAHEVSSIVPEAITGEKDAVDKDGNPEYQGIDQSKLVPLLVKTIQELEARIATLESK